MNLVQVIRLHCWQRQPDPFDNGKQVFSVYSRNNNKALRIYFKGNVIKRMDELRQKAALGETRKAIDTTSWL